MFRHGNELRQRTIDYYKQVKSKTKTLKVFKIARQTLYDWIKEEEKGELLIIREVPKRQTKVDINGMLEYIKQNPDRYYHEIGQAFGCSKSTAFYLLKKHNITVKKNEQSTKRQMIQRKMNLEN